MEEELNDPMYLKTTNGDHAVLVGVICITILVLVPLVYFILIKPRLEKENYEDKHELDGYEGGDQEEDKADFSVEYNQDEYECMQDYM